MTLSSLQIIHYPHPVLRYKSHPLKRVDAELRSMIAQMFELMYQHEGVGLAANQVDLPYRMFVINPEGKPDAKEEEKVFINPVLSTPKGSAEAEEGCLSIPGVFGPVVRAEKIHVQAYDLQGNEIEGDLSGFLARVVQHETDHLDGTLFIDRLSPTSKMAIQEDLEDFEIEFQSKRDTGELPNETLMAERLAQLAKQRT